MLHENESIYGPSGARHRLENPGKIRPVAILVTTISNGLGTTIIVRVGKRSMPSETGSLPASLTMAERYRRDIRLAEAGEICRRVLAAQPNSDEGWHLLGVIAQDSGRIGEAISRSVQ
jgi:hypothetical protein